MSIKNRFIFSLIISLPMLVQMILMPWGWMLPGGDWLMFGLATVEMIVAAGPFLHSAWAAFKNHQANMDTLVAIGTLTAYLYSVYALFTHRAVFFESAVFIITFILLGQVLEEKMRTNASSAVKKLINLQAKTAEVMRAGQFMQVPLQEVQVDDILRVKPGQKIAVDGVITQGTSNIDESMVTGESMPVTKKVGDQVIGATINKNGTFLFQAQKIGPDTLLSQIVEMVKKAQTSRAPIQKLTDKISNIFVPAVLIIAILTFVIWNIFLQASTVRALLFAVSVVIIACPCALGLATPTALMVGTGRSAKAGILIKNGEVLEAADNIQTVVFDKTGTITHGQPQVTDIVGSNPKQILQIAASIETASEHPLAQAIVQAAQKQELSLIPAADFQTIVGKGVRAQLQDKQFYIGSEQLFSQNSISEKLRQQKEQLQNEAKTVVIVGEVGTAQGLIAIQDTPKSSAAAAIAALKRQGLKTVMFTGDNQQVAQAIAQKVGIDQVFANVLPNDKAQIVQQLQRHNNVAFVGDGINDAPALTLANVGIAMGSGTDIAIEAGGIVLVKNDLRGVVQALELSRKTFQRIKFNLFWAFIYNALGIPIAAGVFVGWGLVLSPELASLVMALSSISVVLSSLLLNKVKLTPVN